METLPGGFFWENRMRMTARIILSAGILILDSMIFFIPLSAFFLAYVILFNPPWFRQFLIEADRSDRT